MLCWINGLSHRNIIECVLREKRIAWCIKCAKTFPLTAVVEESRVADQRRAPIKLQQLELYVRIQNKKSSLAMWCGKPGALVKRKESTRTRERVAERHTTASEQTNGYENNWEETYSEEEDGSAQDSRAQNCSSSPIV